MLNLRQTLLLVCFLTDSVIASSLNALIGCGGGEANLQRHAIVPDKTCQPIDPQSSTGAFNIVQLGSNSADSRLAFSATPDCKRVFVPTREQLAAHQLSENCVELHAEGEPQALRFVTLVTEQ